MVAEGAALIATTLASKIDTGRINWTSVGINAAGIVVGGAVSAAFSGEEEIAGALKSLARSPIVRKSGDALKGLARIDVRKTAKNIGFNANNNVYGSGFVGTLASGLQAQNQDQN